MTYTALFKGLCSADRLDDAMSMFSRMQSSGVRANNRTFSTLMRGCMRGARGAENSAAFRAGALSYTSCCR